MLTSDNVNVRAEARNLLAGRDEERASALISQLLDDQLADMSEKQLAFATLARMKSPSAGQSLDEWAVRLREGNVPPSLQLDLMDALTAWPTESRQAAMNEFRASGDLSDPLAAFQVTLVTPANETIRIARNTIDEQSATTSAMPAMTRALTLREIRDLTEYLSALTTRSEPK